LARLTMRHWPWSMIRRNRSGCLGWQSAVRMAVRGALRVAARKSLAIERLDLRNSGDTAGDRTSVVGYGAWLMRAPD